MRALRARGAAMRATAGARAALAGLARLVDLVGLTGLACLPVLAPGPAFAQVPVRPGVTTHFSQGWLLRLLDDAKALGVATIRDSVHWGMVERSPGRVEFTEVNSGHVTRACQAGIGVLLGIEPRNRLYDGGNTAFTPAAQAAFARYVRALADRWGDCLVGVEIGNEINGLKGMTGPAAQARATAHVDLLKAVYRAVKPGHPALALLGGSANTIPTGFLARLFAAGALDWVDGIAVHPYRLQPEGLDWELARLDAAMRRGGTVRPIWATEFSQDFADPALAPAWYLKSIALLESSGISNHFWYALADQPSFPTMGLVKFDGTRKPAARAFAFAARALAPLGPARRVDEGDPALLHFRFGADTHVVWGARRSLAVPAGAAAFAADGTALPLPTRVSDEPVVIRGAATLAFGPPEVLADSLHGFARAPLGWWARRKDGSLLPLTPVDWDWTSYLGTPSMPLLAAHPAEIGTVPAAGMIVRYTPPAGAAGGLTAALCLHAARAGMETAAALMAGPRVVWRADLGPQGRLTAAVAVRLGAGERLDLVLAPLPGRPLARVRYRFQVVRGAAEAPTC